jgi:hypothetical protein
MEKSLKSLIQENLKFDKVMFHKDGAVTVKRSYFYTHGYNCDKLAEKIKQLLPTLKIEIIEQDDQFKTWPKTSYFVVKFKVLGEI